jgi:hypothetical protein
MTGMGERSSSSVGDGAECFVQARVALAADHDRARLVALGGVQQRADGVRVAALRHEVEAEQLLGALEQQLVDQGAPGALALLGAREHGCGRVQRAPGVHDHELAVGGELAGEVCS